MIRDWEDSHSFLNLPFKLERTLRGIMNVPQGTITHCLIKLFSNIENLHFLSDFMSFLIFWRSGCQTLS